MMPKAELAEYCAGRLSTTTLGAVLDRAIFFNDSIQHRRSSAGMYAMSRQLSVPSSSDQIVCSLQKLQRYMPAHERPSSPNKLT